MENDAVDRDAAVAQLAALRADRAALADRVLQPWWHDAGAGLLLFGLFTAQLVEPSWLASVRWSRPTGGSPGSGSTHRPG